MTRRAGQPGGADLSEAAPRRRSFVTLLLLSVVAGLAFTGFVALGTWQLYRLQWKLALIERVEQRVHAAPVSAPGPERWTAINAESDEYRHVEVFGTYLCELTTPVQASTELGSGYWLLTPLKDPSGNVVIVNRGFISGEAASRHRFHPFDGRCDAPSPSASPAKGLAVTGLLRMSEPGGGFLRHNDPANERWYSRDVQAIAAARQLSRVAPYFIDADAAPGKGTAAGDADQPVAGLTVISFHNNHLVYALTWYALALMVGGAAFWIARDERRARQRARQRAHDGAV